MSGEPAAELHGSLSGSCATDEPSLRVGEREPAPTIDSMEKPIFGLTIIGVAATCIILKRRKPRERRECRVGQCCRSAEHAQCKPNRTVRSGDHARTNDDVPMVTETIRSCIRTAIKSRESHKREEKNRTARNRMRLTRAPGELLFTISATIRTMGNDDYTLL